MKQYHKYKINFGSKAIWLSGICMGIAVFLLAVYYLFIQNLAAVSAVRQIFLLWLPMALCLTYIVLIRLVQWNSPGAFAILGGVLCVLLMISVIFTGSIGRVILGIFVYLLCGAVLVVTAGGFLPGRLPASICFGAALVGRLLFFSLSRVSGSAWLEEIAVLSMIAGLMFLPMGFRKVKKKELQ